LTVLLLAATLGCALPPLRPPTVRTVVAAGLTAPRQLALGPNGSLYVAEVGTESAGGSIARIQAGHVETVTSGLPYVAYGGDEEVGTSGLALRGDAMYVVQGEGGGDLGGKLLRVYPRQRATEPIADLLGFQRTRHPAARPPESNPYAVLYDASTDAFDVVDSAANDLLQVTPAGAIRVLAQWSNDDVPTGLARGPDGDLYVALFSPYPYRVGSGHVDRVRPDGTIQTAAAGLTTPIGVAFDRDGAMYVLQFAGGYRDRAPIGFIPNSGSILRVTERGAETVVDGLPFPTAILAGRAGGIVLVSLRGALSAPGSGSIEAIHMGVG
jgi:hypothetical protein